MISDFTYCDHKTIRENKKNPTINVLMLGLDVKSKKDFPFVSRRAVKVRESPTVMQPNSSQEGTHLRNGLSLTLQAELPSRTTPSGAAGTIHSDTNDVRVTLSGGAPGESGGAASARRSRINPHSHSHSHGHTRGQRHPASDADPTDSADLDSGEPSTSLSELRCLFRWFQKSLPFLIILSAKLVLQHALGECKQTRRLYSAAPTVQDQFN